VHFFPLVVLLVTGIRAFAFPPLSGSYWNLPPSFLADSVSGPPPPEADPLSSCALFDVRRFDFFFSNFPIASAFFRRAAFSGEFSSFEVVGN